MKKKSEVLHKNKTGSQDTASVDKRAKESQLESAEKYQNFLKNIHDGCCELDLAGNFTFFNDSACRILGYSREELMGMNYRHYTDKENAKKVSEAYLKVYNTGEPSKGFNWQVIRKDGAKRYIETSVSLQKDSSGKPTGFIGIVNDITERKKVEEKLRESERQYRFLTEKMSDIIWIADMNLRIIYISPSVKNVLGFSQEERMHQTLNEQLTPNSLSLVLDVLSKELTSEKRGNADPNRTLKMELEYYHKDGSTRWMDLVISGIRNDQGVLTSIHGVSRDITERKKAEEKLLESEANYRQLFDNSPAGIYRLDYKNGRFLKANDVFCKYVGCNQEEITSLSPYDILTEESKKLFSERAEKISRGVKVPEIVEFEILNKKGERFHLQLHIKNVYDAEGHVVAADVVAHDITERKKVEEKLHHEERRFRAFVENSSDIIVVVNREGTVTYENPAFEKVLGFKPEERIGANGFEIVHPDDIKELTDVFNTLCSDTSSPVIRGELRLRHKDGSWRTLEAVGSNLVKNNVVESIIVNYRDITERKKADAKLQQTLESLKRAIGTTIQVLVSASESRDPYTAGHQKKSADVAVAIAMEMGLSQDKIEGIRMAGIIHDIGKLSIPAEILSKPSKLTEIEFSLIKEHTRSGYEMLKDVESPWPLAEIVYQHHERLNGTGYPRNLKGNEILIESQILAVADVLEAMASHRPYRAALGIEAALEEIEKNKGILYDNAVADACLRLFREKGYKLK